jgi:radical SAM protein with 4Fe4S-binding SPASM domain
MEQPSNIPSPTFCTIPWTHLAFEPNGKVIPCCMTAEQNYVAGNLNTMTIEEIWNSDNMKTLRKQMMSGEEPKACRKCFDKERVTPGDSNRVYHNYYFQDKIKEVAEITSEDGTCNKIDLQYWDFRFSSKCNFKCRSCGPTYSSAWVEDAKILYHGGKDPGPENDHMELWKRKVKLTENVDNESRFEFLKKQVTAVKKIYFAGGEPLIMDEHYFILDMLLEQGRTDVYISYNTNTSNLTYKGKNVLDYWRKWDPKKIEVWPSIDEIGPRAELIRSGTVWADVEENLKQMSELDIWIRPGMTISAFNVFRLPEMIKHLISIGVIKEKYGYKNWFVNLLETPIHYHVTILSDKFKAEIYKKLDNFIVEMKEKYNVDYTDHLTYIKHQLTLPHNPQAKKSFINMTTQLDELRKENTYEVIPELKDVLTESETVIPEPRAVYSWAKCGCGKTKNSDNSCDGSHSK